MKFSRGPKCSCVSFKEDFRPSLSTSVLHMRVLCSGRRWKKLCLNSLVFPVYALRPHQRGVTWYLGGWLQDRGSSWDLKWHLVRKGRHGNSFHPVTRSERCHRCTAPSSSSSVALCKINAAFCLVPDLPKELSSPASGRGRG